MFFSSDASKIGVVEAPALPILQMKLRRASAEFTVLNVDKVSAYVIVVNQLIKATYDFIAQQDVVSFASVVQPKIELNKLNHDAVMLMFNAKNSGGGPDILQAITAGIESVYHEMHVNSRRDDVFVVLRNYFYTEFLVHQANLSLDEQREVVSLLRDFTGRDPEIDSFVVSSPLETEVSNLLPPLLTRCSHLHA